MTETATEPTVKGAKGYAKDVQDVIEAFKGWNLLKLKEFKECY